MKAAPFSTGKGTGVGTGEDVVGPKLIAGGRVVLDSGTIVGGAWSTGLAEGASVVGAAVVGGRVLSTGGSEGDSVTGALVG